MPGGEAPTGRRGGGEPGAVRPLRRRAPRVRHHAPGHAAALDQLPGHRGVLRHHLEHRRRLLLLPRRPAAPPDALPLQQRPRPTRGGRYFYVRDDATGDYWSPSWQPTRSRPRRRTSAGTAWATPRISSARAGIRAETLYFVPLGETARGVAAARDQRALRRRRSCRSSPSSSSACGTPRTTRRTSSATSPPARSRSVDGVDLPQDRVPRAARPLRVLRLLGAAGRASTPSARRSSARTAAGTSRRWSSAGASGDSVAHGWAPIGSHHVRARRSRRARRARSSSCSATSRTRATRSSTRRGSQTLNKTHVRAGDRDAGCGPDAVAERRSRRCATHWTRCCSAYCRWTRRTTSTDRMVNIWNPYQCMVTFNMLARRRTSSPASAAAWASATPTRICSGFVHMVPERARERILDIACDPVAGRRRVPPVPAADQARQQRHRQRLQRRPAVAGPGRRRLHQGDRRLRRSSTSRCRSTTRPGTEDAALRAPAALASLHARPPRPARPAADRARRLERLPQPQLLLRHAGRVVPDHREPRRRRRPSRCSSPGMFVLAAEELAGIADMRGQADEAPSVPAAAAETHGRRRSPSTAGTASGSCAPTTSSATRSAPTTTTEGQIFIEPQGMCVMAGIGVEDGRAAQALDARARSGWPRRTASCCSSRRTPATTSSSARSPRTRPATRRTPASSATTTRGS